VQPGHSLLKSAIAANATRNDAVNTTEYEMHNLFGLHISNAAYEALITLFPGRRPFTVGRSTFAGSGGVTSHWGGDNTSTWGSMFLSISQAFTFMMSGLPMFGADTCGFAGNTHYELCSRWMQLSAFFGKSVYKITTKPNQSMTQTNTNPSEPSLTSHPPSPNPNPN
jgi:alpha-glucosidase